MGDPLRISSWRSLYCSFFSFSGIVRCYFKCVLKSIFSITSAARCKKNTTTKTIQFAWKLLFLGRSTELKLWSIDEETRKLKKLGFPRRDMNSKLDFREKRQGFDGKKPNWNTLWRIMSCDINKLVCEVRCTEKYSCISIFALILKLLAQIASMFSGKYFYSQYL